MMQQDFTIKRVIVRDVHGHHWPRQVKLTFVELLCFSVAFCCLGMQKRSQVKTYSKSYFGKHDKASDVLQACGRK